MKYAKELAKRLPMIGSMAALGGLAFSDDAQADIVDIADPTGVLGPSHLGSGTLPPEEMEKRRIHNEAVRLNSRGL